MSQKHKFTSDGRKVAIVGRLNAQETIVTEIFVTQDGSEIPSGENFVVKSLHDDPVESWKEKRLREIEANYENLQKDYSSKIDLLSRKIRDEVAFLSEKLRQMKFLKEKMKESDFERMVQFISGNCNFMVKLGYSLSIRPFDKEISSTWNGRFEDIKLLSINGATDGELTFRINQYRDGSGSWEQIIPCVSYEEAKDMLSKHIFTKIEKNGIDDSIYNAAKEYGIELPPLNIKEYFEKKREVQEEYVKDAKRRLENFENNLSELKKTIKKLK